MNYNLIRVYERITGEPALKYDKNILDKRSIVRADKEYTQEYIGWLEDRVKDILSDLDDITSRFS